MAQIDDRIVITVDVEKILNANIKDLSKPLDLKQDMVGEMFEGVGL